MGQYRKPYQYYVDEYDRFTIKTLKELKERSKNTLLSEENLINELKNHIIFHDTAVRRSRLKESLIAENMKEDEKRDCLIKQNPIPNNVNCNIRNSSMQFNSHLFEKFNSPILFIFDCPLRHPPKKIVYPNGVECIRPKKKCDKCGYEISSTAKKTNNLLVCTDKCTGCGKITIVDLDLTLTESEKPIEETDREKYCTDYKDRRTFNEDLKAFEDILPLVEKNKAEKMIREEYNLDKIEKPTIPQLEQRLAKGLEMLGFIKFQFEKPQIKRHVIVPFNIQDSTNRSEKESMKNFSKNIKGLLFNSNWRLQSCLSYRLGFIVGCLKSYETDEDLMIIAKDILKKEKYKKETP